MPSPQEALKHPYLQPAKQQFEMLCKVGNQPEIKTQDLKSDVVRKLNSDPKDWRNKIAPDVLRYLCTDKGKTFCYKPSWTDCLRLIRNVKEHWHDRPMPQPEAFYIVGKPSKYFLNLFPSLCVDEHRCNLSAHARVLSLIEGKWRILKELCCFGFQEDKRCLFSSDCSLIIWKRQRRVVCFWRPRIISVNRLQTP